MQCRLGENEGFLWRSWLDVIYDGKMLLGLTGNIATGKSTVFDYLTSRSYILGFDADAVVHELYRCDAVRDELVSCFGEGILGSDQKPCRQKLRALLLSQPDAKPQLEKVFHERVREKYQEKVDSLQSGQWLVADIPLLYETEKLYLFEHVVVVACSKMMQIKRFRERSKLDRDSITKMMNLQDALSQKMVRADFVLWNEGSLSQLHKQIDTLVLHLFT